MRRFNGLIALKLYVPKAVIEKGNMAMSGFVK